MEENDTSQNQIYYQAKEQKKLTKGICWGNGDYEVTGEDRETLGL